MIDLDDADRRGKAATEGPWDSVASMGTPNHAFVVERRKTPSGFPVVCGDGVRTCDADFIAYARNHWQEMVDELRTLRSMTAGLAEAARTPNPDRDFVMECNDALAAKDKLIEQLMRERDEETADWRERDLND